MVSASRNELLPGGVERYSRTAMYKRRGMYKRTIEKKLPQVQDEQTPKPAARKVNTTNDKTGNRVVAAERLPKYYPVESATQAKSSRKTKKQPKARLNAAITPGTVLILLTGRFRGKRVVFLKQLDSGLLLVTGPFKVNGVPLRRVNQAYVIPTSTKIDAAEAVKAAADVTDALFTKVTDKQADQKKKGKKDADALFDGKKKEKTPLDQAFVSLQKKVDSALVPVVKNTPLLKGYLSSLFSLKSNDRPHLLKF
ncbi:hypothetical protein MP228_010147 [Amoeboaphelidium protococcarum]|nr:hypothetical protein MP228_010147 [Amoeboaphelidium protococcarum]